MYDVLWGVPGYVTKCDRGGGQNWPKQRDVLHGRPLTVSIRVSVVASTARYAQHENSMAAIELTGNRALVELYK